MVVQIKLFSEMLCESLNISPEQGTLEDTCCICNKYTSNGFKKKFGANFTSSEYVSNGNVICPECNYLVNNSNEYRRTMFLLTEDELIKFKKKDAKDIVLNLPDKPFYIYLTKTWQKIGWIRMNDAFNLNNKNSIHFVMDYDIIVTDLQQLKRFINFIHDLRVLKIPKKNIELGYFEIHQYKKLKETYGSEKSRNIIRHIKGYVNNPVFDLALYLED